LNPKKLRFNLLEQKSVIVLNELGTEASAVTSAGITGKAAKPQFR